MEEAEDDDYYYDDDDDEHDQEDEDARALLLRRRALHYGTIRRASAEAILSSLFLYAVTALGVGMSTRGLDPKVVAILVGAGKFVAAAMIVIISAKIPQWVSA